MSEKVKEVVKIFHTMTPMELHSANEFLIAISKDKRKDQAIIKRADFNVGDKVAFDHSTRGEIVGTITKKNIVNAIVMPDGANHWQKWSVKYPVLRKVA